MRVARARAGRRDASRHACYSATAFAVSTRVQRHLGRTRAAMERVCPVGWNERRRAVLAGSIPSPPGGARPPARRASSGVLTADSGELPGAPLAWVRRGRARGRSLDCCRGPAAQLVAMSSTPVVRHAKVGHRRRRRSPACVRSDLPPHSIHSESHAATHRGWGSKHLACATQHGASCGVQFARSAGGRADGSRMRGRGA